MRKKSRILTFNIFMYDPQLPGDKPRMANYELEETARIDSIYCPKPYS